MKVQSAEDPFLVLKEAEDLPGEAWEAVLTDETEPLPTSGETKALYPELPPMNLQGDTAEHRDNTHVPPLQETIIPRAG
jgi:hypothetical protein